MAALCTTASRWVVQGPGSARISAKLHISLCSNSSLGVRIQSSLFELWFALNIKSVARADFALSVLTMKLIETPSVKYLECLYDSGSGCILDSDGDLLKPLMPSSYSPIKSESLGQRPRHVSC